MGVYYCAHRVWLWLILVCVGRFVQAALLPSDCPLDFSGLDFSSTVAACANLSYGSCCDHSKALIAVAMSQYTRNTSSLQLPRDLLQPCARFVGATFQYNDIQLPVATWCALNASVLTDSPCQKIRDVNSIHKSSGFLPVQATCSPLHNLADSTSCRDCLDSQAKFLGNMTHNFSTELWRSCADTIFLSVASLGNSDYAMDQANCFFQLEVPNATLLSQSKCPVTLQPGQINSIAKSCSGNDQYNCCASALLELRISLTEAPPMSTTFSISEKEGAACLEDLDSALFTHDMHTNFQKCNIVPDDIFHTSTHGCYGISTVDRIQELLREQSVDFHLIQESCGEASTLCDSCRRAVLDATYVVASTGGAGMKANVLQCCSDLVFLGLVSNFTQPKASEIGSCLYIPLDTPVQDTQPTPPMESPVPSVVDMDVVPSRALTRSVIVLAVCIALTSLALLLLITLVIIVFRKRKILCSQEEMPLTGCNFKQMKSPNLKLAMKRSPIFRRDCAFLFRPFKFLEIQRATDNFSTIIGRGGFGTVYKARFQDGLVAAVKRMNKGTTQGEQEFCKEMELLGRLHHRHLVTLRGYCADRCHERLLVYEYCENGSLKEHLHGLVKPGALTWRRRLQIALGVATGLEYLHSYCEPPLCHRDVKSSNILLSENFTAKIADFGLAHAGKNGDVNFEPVITEVVRGTPGYMDPEYEQTLELTEKSDVYSFGVLLLELITGRRAINDNISLVDWAQKYMDNVECKIAFLVDSELERHEYNLDELKSLIAIIKQCTQSNGKLRPKMQEVVRLLFDIRTTLDSSSRSSQSSSHFIPLGDCVGRDTNCSEEAEFY